MEPEQLREMVKENNNLETQLTKRNQQYIFDLKKSLEAANLSEAEKVNALHDMLPVLVKEQKGGKTARQLFGTVSERTESIISKPVAPKKSSTPVLMWLDNTLLLLGLLSIMIAITGFFSRETAPAYGISTLLFGSAIGGWVFYMMYKYIYQYEYPGADRSKKPGMLKTLLILGGSTLVWVIAFSATTLLPPVLNPVLNPIVVIVIGAAALALRYYLKKKYEIVGSLSVPRR
ncbi:membrane protein [Enterococcus thailandicus]|uniref:DUF1129 domain-containing protein n=1 Tax=Enterococcus TaxID=1350 RepID=UPI001C4BC222|nr:DUF1129 domain-containing protein [Enterococcus thailandicus]MDA3964808.1 DUF1129 domain-containing protein [Enterococcus thailandicus]MDK4352319.1 DUF1129 domain-containing protein [Enterococcus thailandicus]MDT2735067.1 DUF1129 domain-containing protein [Enterococcus thailandicus]MDT2751260.1 DUF1129 domain-containing protein [Enterococcus thailandicus]MDT2776613.1 DUF1129 domain-containing protein [Enterococcus thailandicus]